MEILKVKNLRKTYHDGRLLVLDDVSLSVQRGDMVALMGPSGSGKSTLLHLIGALDTADSGEIALEGVNIGSMSDHELCLVRRKRIGFVFQFYNLLPNLTALENVMLPSLLSGQNYDAARTKALELLRQVSLHDRAEHQPAELSGGQQQRVAIARSLITEPAIILADEPTGALDSRSANDILSLLTTLNKEQKQTILMVTHDPKSAQFAKRRIDMMDGKIIRDNSQ